MPKSKRRVGSKAARSIRNKPKTGRAMGSGRRSHGKTVAQRRINMGVSASPVYGGDHLTKKERLLKRQSGGGGGVAKGNAAVAQG